MGKTASKAQNPVVTLSDGKDTLCDPFTDGGNWIILLVRLFFLSKYLNLILLKRL